MYIPHYMDASWITSVEFTICRAYCESYWHHIVPTHVYIKMYPPQHTWFPTPHQKPPDPGPTIQHFTTSPEPYCANTSNLTYSVSHRHTSHVKKGALVDRGPNGGLAGSDVCIISHTDHQVNIQGIDNHQ